MVVNPMSKIDIDEKREKLLQQEGNILVTGGPGSGKTTISILKASRIIEDQSLEKEQKIIFLSFARPTVARVFQAIQENKGFLSDDAKKSLQVDTYHSFFWSILKTHAYLLGYPKKLTVLPTPEEAIELAPVRDRFPKTKRSDAENIALAVAIKDERKRLAVEEGKICFDQFVSITHELISQSPKIRELISDAYPFIILDEFQDTSATQWEIIKLLGELSTLICLADPEQRIYDFIGADPNRLDHFRTSFNPTEFAFAGDNYRSGGTDIATFGNDLLVGANKGKKYNDVFIYGYPANKNQAFTGLKIATVRARKRLLDANTKDWSVAILVPTIQLMKQVSIAFASKDYGNYEISHTNAVSKEAPILASYVIARLLEPSLQSVSDLQDIIRHLANFYRGRGGEKITKGNLDNASKVEKCGADIQSSIVTGKKLRQNSVSMKILACISEVSAYQKVGNPTEDWLAVRNILANSPCKLFDDVAEDAKQLQLLKKGAELRAMLSEDWLRNDDYENALDIVKSSFVREHFSKGSKPETGVVVLNMHKAKGKQFDEVIIFETWYQEIDGEVKNYGSRIQRPNSDAKQIEQARFNLRVSVTRAKQRTTILTPNTQPCELLV